MSDEVMSEHGVAKPAGATHRGARSISADAHPGAKAGPRHRLDLDPEDAGRLEQLAAGFQLPRSEVVRRLIRAAAECGPALSKDGSAAITELTREVRGLEFRLRRVAGQGRSRPAASDVAVPHAVDTDAAAQPKLAVADEGDLEAIVERLVDVYAAMNRELNEITLGYGSRLRSLVGDLEGAR